MLFGHGEGAVGLVRAIGVAVGMRHRAGVEVVCVVLHHGGRVERAVDAGGVFKHFDGLDVRGLNNVSFHAGRLERQECETHLIDVLLRYRLGLVVTLKQQPGTTRQSDGDIWIAYAGADDSVIVSCSPHLLGGFAV